MDVRKRLSLVSIVLAGTTSILSIMAAAQSMSKPISPGAMRERSILVWKPPSELESIIIKVWDPQPHLKREPSWMPEDPATLFDGDDAKGVTGRRRLVWRQAGTADYDTSAIDTVYEGDLVDGRPEGFREQTDSSGSKYHGQWHDGVPNGKGDLLLSNGDQYRGEFDDVMFDGRGEYARTSGKLSAGRFEPWGGVDGQKRLVLQGDYPATTAIGADRNVDRIGDSVPVSWGLLPVRFGAGDIEFKVYTDRQRTRAESAEAYCHYCCLTYDHRIEGDDVRVSPSNTRLMRAWKENSRVDVASIGCDEYGDFPVFLVGDITNNSRDVLSVERAFLDVSLSIPDLQPFPIVSTCFSYHDLGEDCGCNTENLDDKIVIDNFGWGRIENARTSLRFSGPGQSDTEQSRVVDIDLRSFKDYQTIRVFPLLQELGVQTDRLRLRDRRCASWSAMPRCVREVAASGIFGELTNHLYVIHQFAATDLVGKLSYEWADALGDRHSHSSPFRVTIPVYGFTVGGGACGAGGPLSYAKRVIDLPVNRTNYQVNFDLPAPARVIRPRQNPRFALVIDSRQSALHAFRVVLELSDGRRIKSALVRVNIFKWRTDKTYTANRHFRIYVPPPGG